MRQRIIYAGNFRLPDFDAAAHRVHGIGKVLREIGYQVDFIGISEQVGNSKELWRTFDQFRFLSVNRSAGRLGGIARIDTMARLLTDEIAASAGELACVILYNSPGKICRTVLREAGKYAIPVVGDVTEWYSSHQLPGGFLNPFFYDGELRMRFFWPQTGNIIAISDFLEAYYHSSCQVINIPPLVDLAENKWHIRSAVPETTAVLQIGYAGTPGRKDNLELLLRAIEELKHEKLHIVLNLYGPSIKDLEKVLEDVSLLDKLQDRLIFHGRIPHEQLLTRLQKNDFTFLYRPLLRYAMAGFPTKFVESMAAGIPVIANLSSNIGRFLKDGWNGIIISGDDLTTALKQACSYSPEQLRWMRNNARRTAEESFDYRVHTARLATFMTSLKLPR